MADKEAKFKVIVEGEAKRGSGEKSKKQLETEINKKGPIKVPIDITVPIDKINTKLTKAQKVVVDRIGKMTSEGFSASEKELGILDNKLHKFKGLAKKAGQKNNPVVKEIEQQVISLRKQHIELKKAEKIIYNQSNINRTGKSRKNQFTPEQTRNIAKDILPELRRILTDIQKGKTNVSSEKFFKTLETILKLNKEAGVNSLKSTKDILNVTLSKWFGTKGRSRFWKWNK